MKIMMAAVVTATMLALAACGSSQIGTGDTQKESIAAGSGAVQPSEAVKDEMHKITFIVQAETEEQTIDVSNDYSTNAATFGDFLRTYPDCQWEDSTYGIFVQGFFGIANDDSQELWWQLFVNGESAAEGADFYEIKDGDEYKYVLTKGYDW